MQYRFFCIRVVISTLFMVSLIITSIAGCAGWTINGIRAEQIYTAQPADLAKIGAGMLTSLAIHTAGHIVMLETANLDYHLEFGFPGTYEVVDEPTTNSERQWMGRSGALAQLVVGCILEKAKVDRYFKTGYHSTTALQILSYPAVHQDSHVGDIEMINLGNGDGELEWFVYSITAGILFLNNASLSMCIVCPVTIESLE